MKIFALSDPHLSFSAEKPMDIFGGNWQNHAEKIRTNWRKAVSGQDIVLVPGDISWAMKLAHAMDDLAFLRKLPGEKIFVRGNHDYWWSSLKKISEAAGDGMHFIQNNSITMNGVAFAGTRLWNFPYIHWPMPERCRTEKKVPGEPAENTRAEDDEKIRNNEINRLQNSLSRLPSDAELKICLTHFPPVSLQPEENEITDILSKSGIDICVYGHVHGFISEDPVPASDCNINGVRYIFSSCDWLDFNPIQIAEL